MLLKMSVRELKEYIDNIVQEYYNSITNQDGNKLNQCIVLLDSLKVIFEDKDLDKYITFRLITGFNEVLLNSSINDFALPDINEPGLTPEKNNILYMTRLDRIIDAVFYQKVSDKEKELLDGINSNEDILDLFNYENYAKNDE